MKLLTLPLVVLLISIGFEGKSFDFLSLEFEHKQLIFKTHNEKEAYPFYVERWINDNWVTIHEIYGEGGLDTNTYVVDVQSVFYGMNKFRIKKETGWEYFVFSNPLSFFHRNNKVYPFVAEQKILFSDTVYNRVETENGDQIFEAFSNSIEVSQLDKGNYILWYNNRKTFFRKTRSKIVLKNKL